MKLLNRKQEALNILKNNPTIRKYISSIPCVKCNNKEMRINMANGSISSVRCWECGRLKSLNAARRYRLTEEGAKKRCMATNAWKKENPLSVDLRRTLSRLDQSLSNLRENNSSLKNIVGYSADDYNKKLGKRKKDYQLDHILSLSWFIKNNIFDIKLIHSLNNLQFISRTANAAKRDKWLPEYGEGMTEWEWCYKLQLSVYGEIRYKE